MRTDKRMTRAGAVRSVLLLAVAAGVTGCGGEALETRTFELRYLPSHQVESILGPYVYADRERNPGRMAVTDQAVTVRETEDNLDKIARVLAQYDRPRPSVMLHFQVIEADGATGADPAIAEVEQELRRLFRFDGYELLADARVGGIEQSMIRQRLGEQLMIEAGIVEVRPTTGTGTVTIDVALHAGGLGRVLQTSVTVPEGHAVVLGTTEAPGEEGPDGPTRAIILVVRAEIVEASPERPPAGDAPPADSA